MPNVIWSELEGKSWKLDVGSTMEEAMSSNENNKLFVTTDGQIVMNGTVLCNGVYATLLHPDKLFSLTKYSSQEEILEAFTLRIDGYGEKTMTTADDVGNLFGYIYQFGFKVWCDNEQMSFLQVAIEEATKAMVFNISIERNLNGNTYKSCVRIKGESDGKGGATLTVLSSYKKRKINEPKISEPDFKVCVRKCIPLHPRKGMKYYFDDGTVRFKVTKKELIGSYDIVTIPNDGNIYCLHRFGLDDKVLPGNTVISGANYNQYEDYFNGDTLIIYRLTYSCTLVTIIRERKKDYFDNSLSDNYIRVSCADEQSFNFEGRKRYTKVVNGEYRYSLPIPDLRPGEEINMKDYAIFKRKKKRFRYYGGNDDSIVTDSKYNVLIDRQGSERKTGYRICRKYKEQKGVVYISRYKNKARYNRSPKGKKRVIYGPLVKYYIDEIYKIKKRI